MSKKNNLLFKTLILGNLALILSGCTSSNTSQSTTSITANDNSGSDDKIVSQSEVVKNIVINANRCSGCGKCQRIDPEHFTINSSERVATVISQDNTNSTNLQMAISMCHDRAIILS